MNADELEKMLKDDAFGRLDEAGEAWLRSPGQIHLSVSQLRIMVANLTSQVEIAQTKPENSRPEWLASVQRLCATMRARLVEYEEMAKGQDSRYRAAIQHHRDSIDADEAGEADVDLWAVLDG